MKRVKTAVQAGMPALWRQLVLGTGFGITAGANKGKGRGDGDDLYYTNSIVGTETGQTTIISGGNTNIMGGEVYGKGVELNVGGDLTIVSLQDQSTYHSDQKDSSIQGTWMLGGGSVSGSHNQSKIDADHLSVADKSGIFAGDEGFQVNVEGNTHLSGGFIVANEKAELEGLNRFETGTLTANALENHSKYEGEGFGISGGMGFDTTKKPGHPKDVNKTQVEPSYEPDGSNTLTASAGYGKDNDSASSVTESGIGTSNITITDHEKQKELTGQTAEAAAKDIETHITTETADAHSGVLENIFDKDDVYKEINLQVKVTQEFRRNAQEAIDTYVEIQTGSLKDDINTLKDKANSDGFLTQEEQEKLVDLVSDFYKVEYQKKFLETLTGILVGMPEAAITQGTLGATATAMREESVRNSLLFPGVVDEEGNVLSNTSGESGGMYGDGIKLGGTRVSLDQVCGKDYSYCERVEDPNANGLDPYLKDANGHCILERNDSGQVLFTGGEDKEGNVIYKNFEAFLQSEEGRKLGGLTGGVQGHDGTIAGKPYKPGVFWDTVVEGFAGTHDYLGGQVFFYDDEGNGTSHQSPVLKITTEVGTVIAIPISAPTAVADLLPPSLFELIFK